MGFEEGSIVLNSENETYYAGQVIYGKLVFEQDKVKTFRGIYVKIKGFCKVHWTTTHTRRQNDRNQTYTENHDSFEEYFSMKTYLRGGENGEYHLQPGKHEMPFECPIPANCPSSFEGDYGHVRYQIKVVVDRAFKIDQEKIRGVRVIAPINLSADPYCQEPLQFDIEDTYCCCCTSSGSSETVVKLPAAGFWPGQLVPVEVSCSNQGRVCVDHIKLAIKKRVTFHATQNPGTKHESETIAEIKKGSVPGGATRSWVVDVQVPLMDVFNMGPCRYIDVDYEFKVTVSPEGCHSDSEDTRRIVIGSSPDQPPFLPPPQQSLPVASQQASQYSPYPGSNQQYAPQVSPYPVQNSSYPPQNSPYPGQNSPYPPQNAPYPGQNSPYPPQNASYPGQNSPYPPQNASYPGQNSPYPPQNGPYPGQNSPYPPQNAPYPAQNSSFPPQNTPAGENSPYPARISPYPVQISPSPVPNSPYPARYPLESSPSAPPLALSPPSVPMPTMPTMPMMPTMPTMPPMPPLLVVTVGGGDGKAPSDPPPPYNPNFVEPKQEK